MSKIQLSPELAIEADSVAFKFVRATGPGGQKVNKTASAVQLFFTLDSSGLPSEIMKEIRLLARNRFNADGVLVIESKEYRSQNQNKEAALARLARIVETAATPKAKRVATRVPQRSKRKRRTEKRRTAEKKEGRRKPTVGGSGE